MADVYVDNLISSKITDYSVADRDDTGSETAYNTLTEALTDLSSTPTNIFFREGECDDLSGALSIAVAHTITPYREEITYITVQTGTFNAITFATNASTFGKLGNQINMRGGGDGTNTPRCIFINKDSQITHVWISDYTSEPLRYTGGIGDLSGTIKTERCTRSMTFNSSDAAASNWACIEIINCSVTAGVGGMNIGSSATTNVAEMIVVGGGTPTNGQGMITIGSTAVCVIDYLKSVGVGADGNSCFIINHNAGTMTVNSGHVNGNIQDPLNVITSGTVTYGAGVIFNDYITVANSPVVKKKASFMMWDSNHAASNGTITSTIGWSTAFEGRAKYVFCPDDAGHLTEEQKTNIGVVLAEGHELGAEGESSTALDLATDATNQPFSVYRSSGSGAVTFEIDTDTANTLIIRVDGGTEATLDLASTVDNIGNSVIPGGPSYLFTVLDGQVFGTATLTLIEPTLDDAYGTNSWDDALTTILQSETSLAIGTSVGTATPLTVDRQKWFAADITATRATLLGLFPTASLKTFTNFRMLDVTADAQTAITQGGFPNAYAGITQRDEANPSGINDFPDLSSLSGLGKLVAYRGTAKIRGDAVDTSIYTAYADGLATNEANIRGWVSAICSYATAFGLYLGVELDRKTNTIASASVSGYVFSDDDIRWMIDQFELNGYDVVTTEVAAADFRDTGSSSGIALTGPLTGGITG